MAPNYFIWTPDPTIFHLYGFAIKWYSVFILIAFLGGRKIVRHIYEKTERPPEDVDRLCIWVLCSALIGARLGEVFFYDFQYYFNHPLEALLPFRFTPHFRFTGYQGLSYHGALIGGAIGTYVYANYDIVLRLFPPLFKFKKQPRQGQSFLWLTTPVALGITMGFLVRIGNFVNSEIVGTPTNTAYGILFAHDIVEQLHESTDAIDRIRLFSNEGTQRVSTTHQPITIEVIFKETETDEAAVRNLLNNNIKQCLVNSPPVKEHVYEPSGVPLKYLLGRTAHKAYFAHIATWGIPRHPVQLYESIAYLITLLLLLHIWGGLHKYIRDGVIAANAMIICYSIRFICEFFKEPFNVLYEGPVTLTVGHLLSLLTVLVGVLLLLYARSFPKKTVTTVSDK